jgi:DNA-binding response OmpR family regulator
MITLTQELADQGTLLTRIDRPEDTPDFLRLAASDMLLLEGSQLKPNRLSLSDLKCKGPHTPIALFSSEEDNDQISSWFQSGADAVIPMHTPVDEVILRLRAVACRNRGLAMPRADLGPLQLDLPNRRAYIYDCPLKLGPKQYELLEYICLRPNQLVTRSELLTHIYGFEDEPDSRVFDVYFCNLRTYLKPISGEIDIETVRGVGYRLTTDQRDTAAA